MTPDDRVCYGLCVYERCWNVDITCKYRTILTRTVICVKQIERQDLIILLQICWGFKRTCTTPQVPKHSESYLQMFRKLRFEYDIIHTLDCLTNRLKM